VGKLLGEKLAMKGGLGVASFSKGELTVTAVVVVNAVGNVIDRSERKVLAGVRDPHDPFSVIDANSAFEIMAASNDGKSATLTGTNTTIGCILTNARITKAQATHIADMAHDGLARAIDPVHTGFDGDAIFALSSTKIEASHDYLGMVSAWVMEEAIHDAVLSVESFYDLPSARSLAQ
jgi:L-aminopeptidase/D-esterase-like protein